MKKIILTFTAVIAAFYAHAQIPQPDPDTTTKHFLVVASIGNLQEVSASQLALKSASDAKVKSFANMMVQDHSKGETQLLQLASRQKISLPAAATSGVLQDIQLLEAKGKFDQLYVHKMVADHNDTVQTFERYATVGKDPDVRKFAQDMLPSLKMHLQMIKALEKEMNATK